MFKPSWKSLNYWAEPHLLLNETSRREIRARESERTHSSRSPISAAA